METHELLATALRVAYPADGPPMVEHRFVRHARPTSALDVLWSRQREPLPEGVRVLLHDREWDTAVERLLARCDGEFYLCPAAEYHAAMLSAPPPGRPSPFLKFGFNQLVNWRDDIWSGDITIRDVMRQAGVSEPAAQRFAHGETLWWI